MYAVTYSDTRANLAEILERVCDSHEPLIVTRKGKQSVVLMSLEEYQILTEVLPRLDELENGTVQRVSGDEWFNSRRA